MKSKRRLRMTGLLGGLVFLAGPAFCADDSAGIGDAINAEWGSYKLDWGKHYYDLDKLKDGDAEAPEEPAEPAPPAQAAPVESAAIETTKRKPGRSLRSREGERASDQKPAEDAAGAEAEE